jgi:LysM repeat protein
MLRNIFCLIGVVFFASACSLTQAVPPTPEALNDLPTAVAAVPSQVFDVLTSTPVVTEEAPTDTPPPTTQPASQNTVKPALISAVLPNCTPRTDWPMYTVVAGDTMAGIARRSNSTVANLTAANCLANANVITVGQQLRVPTLPVVTDPPNVTYVGQVAVSPATFNAAANTYIVQAGGSVLLTWQSAALSGLDSVEFALLPLSPTARLQGLQSFIGSDNYLADGATITYAVPATGALGYPVAVGKKGGQIVSRSNLAFALSTGSPTQPCIAQVNVPATNLYSGPAQTYVIVSTVAGSDTFTVTGRADNGWFQVTYNNASPWIDKNVVSLSGDCSAIPLVSVPAPAPCMAVIPALTGLYRGIGWPEPFAQVNAGEQYPVIGKNGDNWYKLNYPAAAPGDAWITKASITLTGDCSAVPIASSIRPPAPEYPPETEATDEPLPFDETA